LRACPDAPLGRNKRAKIRKLVTFIFLASFCAGYSNRDFVPLIRLWLETLAGSIEPRKVLKI
jgi:hypothetical protein